MQVKMNCNLDKIDNLKITKDSFIDDYDTTDSIVDHLEIYHSLVIIETDGNEKLVLHMDKELPKCTVMKINGKCYNGEVGMAVGTYLKINDLIEFNMDDLVKKDCKHWLGGDGQKTFKVKKAELCKLSEASFSRTTVGPKTVQS
mmetsp:Transcript_3773/g.3215  ORF Transcript_3773/g.3215 Transcript_3773/m.3215 type:complete len:144 (+) Transcript_3773:878-1309(+)